jgi:hypothetical protein
MKYVDVEIIINALYYYKSHVCIDEKLLTLDIDKDTDPIEINKLFNLRIRNLIAEVKDIL